MLEYRSDWGKVQFTLKEYVEQHKISKTKLARMADMQYSQFQLYYNNEIVRPDLTVLARICFVLGCELSDILHYTPPKE